MRPDIYSAHLEDELWDTHSAMTQALLERSPAAEDLHIELISKRHALKVNALQKQVCFACPARAAAPAPRCAHPLNLPLAPITSFHVMITAGLPR